MRDTTLTNKISKRLFIFKCNEDKRLADKLNYEFYYLD